jgi:CP family cyanate transporter-like MFS transporter
MGLSNISLSCVFPVVLLLTGDKSNSAEQTRNLSTMMQSVGYAMSAFGPFVMGQIFQVTGSWNIAMVAMSALAFLQLIAGLIAARPGKIAY